VHASGQWGALGTLLAGGTLVLNTRRHMDMHHVLALIERERVVMLTLVGDTSARPLLAARAEHRSDTSSLLMFGSGGSILSSDVKEALLREFPSVLVILEAIGSSESPAQAVSIVTRDARPFPSLTFAPKADTIVVDEELRPIPPGSGRAGRLATRGRVPVAYHGDAERTRNTFVTIDGDRWSVPGDFAIADADGTIHLLGRGSLCINTGGEKVYPEEVEAVLTTHAAIADALVVGVADPTWGQRVVAVVAPADPAAPPTLESVHDFVRARLAGYKVPRGVVIVDEIRRSAAGKGDYEWALAVAAESASEAPGEERS
jgi:fatty-acyl-CoA synthase